MGSGYCLKNVISLRKAKDGRSKRLKGTSIGRTGDDNSQKEPSRRSSGASIKNHRELEMPLEDKAATKIQTAFRAYVARKTLRCLKGIARLQSMTQGSSVKKQASATLSNLQSWNRIQTEIRARRVSMVIEGRLKQKKVENQLKLEAKLHNVEAEWSGGPETMEVVLARIHQREEAAVKRERTMAYAFSHQWRANSNPIFRSSNHDISKANWGWSWTDRWIAARPWECRIPVQSTPRMANKIARTTPKSYKTQTIKTPVFVKSTFANQKRTIKPRKLSYEAADKLTAEKGINKVDASIEKQVMVS
ncbi:protein IQ-DOMAIN 9 [Nicotiana tabacum]|uniref:Protein IQ-DOMAIN 1 n=2 Tax=Nicotiana tabacum TaxID=4097 RepID=A0A1S4BC85_TOBAC|nr:PREDICTED: protein IQ-DOMAIN 1-like [Nicotiana tabacum]XP_016486436.1 PREDICTED: protein IQ-DOMAIN 1-like [Nicotiana tabacum]XP_016486437.1 PREDICTED: protein IQ-DOMAIN 1-like [Nicotiana tabacum]